MKKLSMKSFACLSLALVVIAALVVRGDEPAEKDRSYWMKKKLEYAEKILSGLATEDFEAIDKTARSMSKLSVLENWTRKSEPYRTQLKIFGYANDELIRMADDKNLDGCAVAYVQLTLSCVNCHRVVRDFDRKAFHPAEQPDRERNSKGKK